VVTKYSILADILNRMSISSEKIILQREKKHCTIFICACRILHVGFPVRVGATEVLRVRVGVRIKQ